MVSAKSKQLSALNLSQEQLDATCSLLKSKVPIPYIAKFQSHLTGGLRDFQLRQVQAVYAYECELEQRKKTLIDSLQAQNSLTDELAEQISKATNKTQLCDIAYPYRPERRNLAHFAKTGTYGEALNKLSATFENEDDFIASFSDVEDKAKVLSDTAILLAEACLGRPTLINQLRKHVYSHGHLRSSIIKGRENAARVVRENISLDKPLSQISYQESLALFRGRAEGINEISVTFKTDEKVFTLIKQAFPNFGLQGDWFDSLLQKSFELSILPKLCIEQLNRLKETNEDKALKTFSKQLHQLVTQSPAGPYVTMGIVNGFKAGVKVVIVDAHGELLDSETIFPLYADGNWNDAQINLAKMITKHDVKSVAIAKKNGAKDILRLINELNDTYQDLQLVKMIISDAGAKAFAHSELALNTFSELDEWQREAVSIARRLQDPISELASLPLTTIDIGLNQQAINPQKVSQTFHAVMEDAINKIGVDINLASEQVLSFVSGLSQSDVTKIIEYRQKHDVILSWEALQSLELSESALSYAGGFIRISHSDNPLDKALIPPTYYALVDKIASSLDCAISELFGNRQQLRTLDATSFISDEIPEPVVQTILRQLERPLLSTRAELKPVQFNSNIKTITDLKVGDILNGVVGNITTFGAFVNIGIEQDGLIHVSEMPNHAKGRQALLVKTGDVVKVKVIGIDCEKKRLNLSLKLGQQAGVKKAPKAGVKKRKPQKEKAPVNSAMADALMKLNLSK